MANIVGLDVDYKVDAAPVGVDESTLRAAEGDRAEKEARLETIKSQFEKFDLNNDGTISKIELFSLLNHLDPHYWSERGVRLNRLWEHLDRNEDGMIEFDEFVHWAFEVDPHIEQSQNSVIAAYFRGALNNVNLEMKQEAAGIAAATEAREQGWTVEYIAEAAAQAAKNAGASAEDAARVAGNTAAGEMRRRNATGHETVEAAVAAARAAGGSQATIGRTAGAVAAEEARAEQKSPEEIAMAAGRAARKSGCDQSDVAFIASIWAAEEARKAGKDAGAIANAAAEAAAASGGSKDDVVNIAQAAAEAEAEKAGLSESERKFLMEKAAQDARMAQSKAASAKKRTVKAPRPSASSSYYGSQEVVSKFRHFDINGDGFIDKKELTKILKMVDPKRWSDREIGRLFRYMDESEDGKIEYAEFVKWCFDNSDGTEKGFMGDFRRAVDGVT